MGTDGIASSLSAASEIKIRFHLLASYTHVFPIIILLLRFLGLVPSSSVSGSAVNTIALPHSAAAS